MEKLTVKNFLSIKEADLELKKFNVIIGYEKDILSKLIYFFRTSLKEAQLYDNNPEKAINRLFNSHFPRDLWRNQKFTINYKIKDIEICIEHNNKLQITTNDYFKNKLKSSQDDIEGIIFIPTGESTFASPLLTVKNTLFIIENPEKYLFPKTQKEFMFSVSRACNTLNNSTLISTNSAYILSSINILLLANDVINKNNNEAKNKMIEELIGKDTALKFEDISAYEVGKNGRTRSFLNHENKLLGGNIIDEAAEELEDLFDKMIEIDLCK